MGEQRDVGSSAGQDGDRLGRFFTDRADDPSTALSALTLGLLEQVLEETASLADGSDEQADLRAIKEVAARHLNRPLTMDPVVVELVEVMLRRQFEAAAPRENWMAIAHNVAERLFDDPRSQERLHGLWRRLSQATE